MYLIFILILTFILFYLNQDNISEKFSVYQTFQSYFPINTYKYPMYSLLNQSPNQSQNQSIYPLIYPSDSSYANGYYIPWSNGYTNLPWWNTSLGNTSNMSYDVRGDPLIIPRTNFVWNNGTTFPIYNQTV